MNQTGVGGSKNQSDKRGMMLCARWFPFSAFLLQGFKLPVLPDALLTLPLKSPSP